MNPTRAARSIPAHTTQLQTSQSKVKMATIIAQQLSAGCVPLTRLFSRARRRAHHRFARLERRRSVRDAKHALNRAGSNLGAPGFGDQTQGGGLGTKRRTAVVCALRRC